MLEGWRAAVAAAMVTVLVAAACLRPVNGDEMARMRTGPGSSLTSSTLRWVDAEAGQTLPVDAVQTEDGGDEEEEGGAVWCRFTDHGSVAGVVRDGVCHAPFLDSVGKSDKYEVLVSINGSARITEMDWSRSAWLSPGGILVSKERVLAVARVADGTALPGYVDIKDRQIFLLNGTRVESFDEAVILTEMEPVKYEMDGVVWDASRDVLETEDRVLVNLTLTNTQEQAQLVSQVVEYTVTETLYWGNVRGTVKGLSATVTGPGGSEWEVTWSASNDYKKVEQQKVALQVAGDAEVDVTLVGVMHKFKSPYTAKLTAVYKDGVRRDRSITAPHEHTYLAELRADFSRPRNLTTGQELEGDFPTSEVLIASTTTTTTTTTTTPPPGTATGAELAGSFSTPEPSLALPLPTLPATLLTCCLTLLICLARP